MFTDHVAVTVMTADLALHLFFHGRGNQVSAAEIVMVLKYSVAIFWPVDTGIFFYECQM